MTTRQLIATASFAPALAAAATPPAWIQLLPAAGPIVALDGRRWTMPAPEIVIAASRGALPMPIDFDHAYDPLDPKEARPAGPAAGWVEELAARGPDGEPGLWGRVAWSTSGAAAIAGLEYRHISPVFAHATDPGKTIGRVLRAALTNLPALTQLKALAQVQPQEQEMSLKAIAAALGLPETADETAILAAIKTKDETAKATASTLSAVAKAVGEEATEGAALVTAVAARIAAAAKPDATAQATIDTLQKQVASLQAERAAEKATAAVDAAIAEGRLTPAQRGWALDYCARDPKGFEGFIAGQPKLIRTGTDTAAAAPADGALSPEEKAICAQLGLSEADYKATLASQKKAV